MWKAAEVSLFSHGLVAKVDYMGTMEDILLGDTSFEWQTSVQSPQSVKFQPRCWPP